MAEQVSRNYTRTALISAGTAAWLIYDMSTATEVPREAVAIMQYGLLGMALFALGGSLVMLMSAK